MKRTDAIVSREILKDLLRVRKLDTMRAIYERITPDEAGVIRTVQSPVGTETGRFAHSETFLEPSTNLGNLPKKTADEPLFNVRECIIPHEGRQLWKSDYNAAEARWCAKIANDTVRLRMYEEGIDQYRYFVAVLEWDDGNRWQEVPKPQRNVIGKVGILAGQYGVSWRKMLDTVNSDADLTGIAIDARQAKKMCDIWPQLFPRTVQWWGEVREQVLTKGYLINPFGRRRDFFGRQDSEQARDALVREAIAFGPQSANADMLNRALSALFKYHDPHNLRILLQVHDEIVGDALPQDMDKVERIVLSTMQKPVMANGEPFSIPAEFTVCERSWAG